MLTKVPQRIGKPSGSVAYEGTGAAEAEFAPIIESGGKVVGYYAPADFAGKTSEAFAVIDVGTMAEYQVCRAMLAAHPKHKESVALIEKQRTSLSIYRAIVQRLEPVRNHE